jgi:hypothetical protein
VSFSLLLFVVAAQPIASFAFSDSFVVWIVWAHFPSRKQGPGNMASARQPTLSQGEIPREPKQSRSNANNSLKNNSFRLSEIL